MLSFALDIADRVFVIEGGHLVHDDSREHIDEATIARFWRSDFTSNEAMHQTTERACNMSKTLIKVDLTESPTKNDIIHNRWHPDIPMVAWVKPGDDFASRRFDWTGGTSRTTTPRPT